jgi:glycosyltransferase involved in cell wall biosynthesis
MQSLTCDSTRRYTLAELRQLPVLKMLSTLRSLRPERLLLPIENDNGRVLLPVLALISSLTRARQIVAIDSQLRETPISRTTAVRYAAQMATASFKGWRAVSHARAELAKLLQTSRIEVPPAARKHALFLNGNLWFGVKAGGSVGHISGVVNGLLGHGLAVTFASPGGKLLTRPEAKYLELEPPEHFGIPWESNFYRFNYDIADQVLASPASGADFIYQRLSVANYSGVLLSRRLNLPLILEYNGSEAWVARNWGKPLREQELAEAAEEACLRHAHLVVTISSVLEDELAARGVPRERIVTYPNCIDPEMFDPARFSSADVAQLRASYGIAPGAVVVTFVGTFGQWHGADVFARSVRHLLDEHTDWARENKLHVLFVGDGLKMPDVRRELGKHAQGSQVTLAGLIAQDRAPLHLAASDILVSPHVPNADGSRFFGSPTKLFEYLAMGKGLIASDLDQIGEILAGSPRVALLGDDIPSDLAGAALLTEPGNANELEKGIRILVDNPQLRESLGRHAREMALKRYTWQIHVGAILQRAADLKVIDGK